MPDRKNSTGKDLAWIIGGGRFGIMAARILASENPPETILVVDREPSALEPAGPLGVRTELSDGLDFLVKNLSPDNSPVWVVAAVPFHLAYKWLLKKLPTETEPFPVPASLVEDLPHPLPSGDGGFFISYATFTCPPDCPSPRISALLPAGPAKGPCIKT